LLGRSHIAVALLALLVACAAPPKKIALAPRPVPSPVIRAIETEIKKAAPWKLIAVREIAGVLLEEYQLAQGPKLALSIDPHARVIVLQAHVAAMSKKSLETETARLQKAVDPLGALTSAGLSMERAYFSVVVLPSVEETALERAAKSLVRPKAVYAATGAIDRVALLTAMKAAFETPVLPDSVPAEHPGALKKSSGVLVGWPVDSATAEEKIALEAAARVLADGPESRLGRALLAKDAQSIEASVSPRSFEIAVMLEPGRTSTVATAAIDREVRAIARGEAMGIEVERARENLRTDMLRELADLETRAWMLGLALANSTGVAGIAQRFVNAAKVDEPAMRAAVAKHLKSSAVSSR
jgi:hypothetical protein